MGKRSDAEAGRKVNFKNASIYRLSFLIAVAMGTGNSWDDCFKILVCSKVVCFEKLVYSKSRMWAAAFRLSALRSSYQAFLQTPGPSKTARKNISIVRSIVSLCPAVLALMA